MIIPRQIEAKIKHLAQKFPIVSLTGARQCGKSTLLKHAFPSYKYVSLEEPDLRFFAQNDGRGFLENFKAPLIIDEAQQVPELFSWLQCKVDEANMPGSYLLSGSNNFLLMEKISQSLAGRTAILYLAPLSTTELTTAGLLPPSLNDYLFTGGYPRLYDQNIDPNDFFPSYIQSYVERDVRLIKNITNLNTFIKFVRLCAGRIGGQLNYESIARDSGISVPTARDWISILEASHIIYLLKPYHRNFGKRLVKAPKLYFYDTALAVHLLGIEKPDQITTHYLRGNLFENMVISEYVKYYLFQGQIPLISYWRDNTQHEVDLLIENGGQLKAVEIKAGATIRPDFFDGLNYFSRLSGLSPEALSLVYGGDLNLKMSQASCQSWKNIELEG